MFQWWRWLWNGFCSTGRRWRYLSHRKCGTCRHAHVSLPIPPTCTLHVNDSSLTALLYVIILVPFMYFGTVCYWQPKKVAYNRLQRSMTDSCFYTNGEWLHSRRPALWRLLGFHKSYQLNQNAFLGYSWSRIRFLWKKPSNCLGR